ncbi:hypothetical protein HDV05_007164 [Chytridiales sp. JEL 0842]|nr:hypothetical protein HDV05_007164 [Chytridiales sp. JEL 0842]
MEIVGLAAGCSSIPSSQIEDLENQLYALNDDLPPTKRSAPSYNNNNIIDIYEDEEFSASNMPTESWNSWNWGPSAALAAQKKEREEEKSFERECRMLAKETGVRRRLITDQASYDLVKLLSNVYTASNIENILDNQLLDDIRYSDRYYDEKGLEYRRPSTLPKPWKPFAESNKQGEEIDHEEEPGSSPAEECGEPEDPPKLVNKVDEERKGKKAAPKLDRKKQDEFVVQDSSEVDFEVEDPPPEINNQESKPRRKKRKSKSGKPVESDASTEPMEEDDKGQENVEPVEEDDNEDVVMEGKQKSLGSNSKQQQRRAKVSVGRVTRDPFAPARAAAGDLNAPSQNKKKPVKRAALVSVEQQRQKLQDTKRQNEDESLHSNTTCPSSKNIAVPPTASSTTSSSFSNNSNKNSSNSNINDNNTKCNINTANIGRKSLRLGGQHEVLPSDISDITPPDSRPTKAGPSENDASQPCSAAPALDLCEGVKTRGMKKRLSSSFDPEENGNNNEEDLAEKRRRRSSRRASLKREGSSVCL